MSADRELLFGFLALQNDCVTREDLIAGVQVWLQDKSKSLAAILVGRKSIDADECDLLQRLTERYLKRHDDDPQKSLAALSSLGPLRTRLQQLGDDDIEASIRMLAGRSPGDDASRPEPDLESTFVPPNSADTRFRILRPHARGGLGEVYVARDAELNREVALKEIQDQFADDPDSRSRFVLEAEVTGGLEHPGIVPVYGLGQYEDGRPYYAMRFIKGDSLKEAIDQFHALSRRSISPEIEGEGGRRPDERAGKNTVGHKRQCHVGVRPGYDSLAFRKLLGRFIDVCQAISYAHSRGVLHRDLKPGNIMLGKYGETLVVDWGLAKVRDRDDASRCDDEATLRPSSGSGVTPTMFGSAIGTPAYMPPEQAAGRLGDLGPASDVYSLGATLYHLLTGQSPFRSGDRGAVLKDVKAGRFSTPRAVLPDVPQPLEAVCLKAMALKPCDRYSSPQLLADDIDHYLADEPVSAFPEPVTVRARRWARKHQTLTVTSAAVLLVSAIGLGTISTIISGMNADLRHSNDQLAAANIRERDARTLAETNEKSARDQSQLALSTLTFVITDIQGGLQGLPGSGEVRRRLLKTSLGKLQSVSTQFLTQAAVDRSTWLALNEMGDVILTFGTDPTVDPSLRRRELTSEFSISTEPTADLHSAVQLAESYYERAFHIAKSLAEADPNNVQKQLDLSLSFNNLGNVCLKLGRTDLALTQFQEGLKINRSLAEADPDDIRKQHAQSVSYSRLGGVFLRLGRTTEALTLFEADLKISRVLAEADPEDAGKQRDLSVSFNKLGDVLLTLGRTEDALTRFQDGLKIRRVLAEEDPDDDEKQRDLAFSFLRLGGMFLTLGRTDDALTQFQNGLQIRRVLAGADPNEAQKQRELSIALERLGDVFLTLGRTADALMQFEEKLTIDRSLVEVDPNHIENQRNLSVSIDRIGHTLIMLGRTDDGLTKFQELLERNRRAAEADPSDTQKQRDLSIALERLGDVLMKLGRTEEALAQFEEKLTIDRVLAESDPDSTQKQFGLSVSFERLGDVFLELGRTDDALKSFEQKFEISKALAEADPNDTRKQQDLSVAFARLGDVFLKVSRADDALTQFENSLNIDRLLAEADPASADRQRDLVISYNQLGTTQMACDEFSMAADSFEAAAQVLRTMIERGMNVERSTSELAMLERQVEAARLTKVALGDWKALLQEPSEELPALLETRGIQCILRSRFPDAAQAAAKMRELVHADNGQLYNAACVFSLCAASIKAADGNELTAEQMIQRQNWINDALVSLKLCIARGWTDFDHMQQDNDLTILRDLPEFQALLPATATPESSSEPESNGK